MKNRSRQTLVEYQRRLDLLDQPERYHKLVRNIRRVTKRTLSPGTLLPLEVRDARFEEIAEEIDETNDDLKLGVESQDRNKVLFDMISREFYYQRCLWVMKKREKARACWHWQGHQRSPITKKYLNSAFRAHNTHWKDPIHPLPVIDLTISDDDDDEIEFIDNYKPRQIKKEMEPESSMEPQKIKPTLMMEASKSVAPALQKFLFECDPQMDCLFDSLWVLGIRSKEDINGMAKWSPARRRDFLKKLRTGPYETPITELQLAVLEHRFSRQAS